MVNLLPPPWRIAVLAHPYLPEAGAEAVRVAAWLRAAGVDKVVEGKLSEDGMRQQVVCGEFDMIIALGGDGTMLRAGHLCAACGIPVLGINLGHFGFLMEIQQHEWQDLLPRLLDGRYRLENRMMLRAELLHGETSLGSWEVLNDVVVCRGGTVRPIRIQARVDGYLLSDYIADGLIASSPTGSTAYALAAGGPILPPETRNLLIVPVAPHLTMGQAIVLPEDVTITFSVHNSYDAVLSVDGQPPVTVREGDIVRVTASPISVAFVRFQDPGYFYRNLARYMEQNPAAGNSR